jgi:hypothetical protein
MLNPIGSIFKFGHGKPEQKRERNEASDADASAQSSEIADSSEVGKSENHAQFEKSKKDKKEKLANAKADKPKLKIVRPDNGPDLTPAPTEEAQTNSEEAASSSSAAGKASVLSGHENASVSFMLKGVNVSARKSVLTVAIKNAGSDAFNFSPDLISVADGSRRLSDAATRADFDTTLVQPNEEVKGTITIFGRPWSDKLTVCLGDGGKAIQMRRP